MQELKDIACAQNLNMCICFYNVEKYARAKEKATTSLEIKQSIKAYYWRAKAKAQLKDYDEACSDINLAIQMGTNDQNGPDLKAELAKYEKYANSARKSSDDKWRKAM